jgi:hypothetical protein
VGRVCDATTRNPGFTSGERLTDYTSEGAQKTGEFRFMRAGFNFHG